MAASGYSPIQLYYSTTASTAPAAGNLVSGELAINITDGKLYYKDNAGAVQLLSTSTTANGTANGVLYLNGSKVATSGSALTFDGTNLGVAMPSPASFLGKFGVNGNIALGTGGIQYFWNSSNVYGWSIRNAVNDLTFANYGGSDQMTLTSTGLGIGTPAPVVKLQVYGATNSALANFTGNSGGSSARGLTISTYVSNGGGDCGVEFNAAINNTGYGGFKFSGGSTTYATIDYSGNVGIGTSSPSSVLHISNAATPTITLTDTRTPVSAQYQVGSSIAFIGTTTNHPVGFTTNNTERMRLDSSGNLGLGVTPSASWVGGYTAFQMQNVGRSLAASGAGSGDLTLAFNAVYDNADARWEYAYTGDAAVRYSQTGAGIHAWYNAASGTANTQISFTQAMTLDASGNLGVGVTSPTQKLEVNGGAAIVGTDPLLLQRPVVPSFDGQGAPAIVWRFYSTGTTYTAGAQIQALAEAAWSSTSAPTGIRFYTVPSGSTTLNERARIDSSGNLLVGTTTANARIEAQNGSAGAAIRASNSAGGYAQLSIESNATSEARVTYTNALKFFDSSTERARIDSSGNLLVGTTSGTSGNGAYGVFGNSSAAGANRWAAFFGTNSSSSSAASNFGLTIGWNKSGGGGESNIVYGVSAGGAPGLAFSSSDGTTVTERARIDSSGNLGVGTTSPSAKLHVAASASDPVLFANSSGSAYNSAIWQNNNNYKMAVGIGGGSVGGNLQDTAYIGPISNIALIFQTNNTERARIDSSGNLQLQNNMSVGGATPTTSGTGITFPATQSASSNANTLDDYEEGTFTPTLSFGGSSTGITYSYQNGLYIKVGRLVFVRVGIVITNKGSGSGVAKFSGFPFTVESISYADAVGPTSFGNMTGLTSPVNIVMNNGSTEAQFRQFNSSNEANLTDAQFTNSSYIYGSFCYNIA